MRPCSFKFHSGLSVTEADDRLKQDGFNEMPGSENRKFLHIVLEVIREPMFLLLVAGGIIYFLLGDVQEAIMLMGFVVVVMGITFYQERKTERALEALRDLSSPRALVVRDGQERRIPGRDVVVGDILILAEGDRIPADAVLLEGSNVSTDESLLTGESASVRKVIWDEKLQLTRPGGDDLPFLFSGTLVVSGKGIARVLSTGLNTELGKIGKSLISVKSEVTRLQKETGSLVKKLALFGIGLCTIIVVVYGLTRGSWLKGILSGITLAMAMMPEEFPVVLTIFLALGAWRMSQKNVLTRRIPAVEILGSATVLCVDKTGTLTQNRMRVSKLMSDGVSFDIHENIRHPLPELFHQLVEFSILAGQKDPFDPMEKALRQLGGLKLANTEHLHDDWTLFHEYPLSQELLALSIVWKSPDGENYVIAAKGAPEAVFDLCHIEPSRLNELTKQVESMAGEGLRVLGVAKAEFQKNEVLPDGQHDFRFQFLGLVGFSDPVRPMVAQAVKECYDAGIRVVMITGDYPVTAKKIGKEVGLHCCDHAITGAELDHMSDDELREKISDVNIFARVVPEQKLRLVKAFRARGEVVAMTGDGVNDAPALKAADIGIAMGARGTDVAREASSMVLLDDDFSSIVEAVRMGRRIFDNLKKAMAYIFAVHVPIAGMSLLPVIFHWPLVLFPVHIVFLELIIDPACSTVFESEPEESDVMKRKPRSLTDPLFSRRMISLSVLQGLIVFLIVLAVYSIALIRGSDEKEARTLTFTTLIVANLGLILINRSWTRTFFNLMRSRNNALWYVISGATFFLGLVLYVPWMRDLFDFSYLHISDILICLAAGAASILWFEGLKIISRRRGNV